MAVQLFDGEEELRGVLSPEALELYEAWRRLGRTPTQALEEVERAGLWVNEGRKSRHLRRPAAFYQKRLGNRMSVAAACAENMPLAGRVLASWQCLTATEIAWLTAVKEGKTLASGLSLDDIAEILAINEKSAAELAAWNAARAAAAKARREHVRPMEDENKACAGYWWRDEPVSFWTAQWKG